ncbi:MAG: ADP-ribosyltransferase domain-containing protein [Oligoflexales bacterium]
MSDDVYALNDQKRSLLKDRRLEFFNDLLISIEDEKTIEKLSGKFGPGNFFQFFGDRPWLCFNKLIVEGCGFSLPLDFVADTEVQLKSQDEIISQGGEAQMESAKTLVQTYPKITVEEMTAIVAYVSTLFGDVNMVLRNQMPIGNYQPVIDTIVSGLRKLPRSKGKVYRGMGYNEQNAQAYAEAFSNGEPIQELAFTSTSNDKNSSFNSVYNLEIESRTGADLSSSINAVEKEVLFAPGTWFRVINIRDSLRGPSQPDPKTMEMVELVILR